MSTTLNLADRLLDMGRKFQALGRDYDALQHLNRLSDFQHLEPEINQETKERLAEILLRNGRCIRARRHINALLVQCPDSARYHYMMAGTLNGDTKNNPQRAVEHYRKSLELDANQPKCLGELGLLLLRLGQVDEGLAKLRQAADIAPDDPEVLGRLVEGLRQQGEDEEARRVLRVALFGHSRDSRFRKLWNDFHFHLLRAEQQAARPYDVDAGALEQGPRILPFVRLVRTEPTEPTEPVEGKVIRHDPASSPQPPHSPRPSRLPGKKHA